MGLRTILYLAATEEFFRKKVIIFRLKINFVNEWKQRKMDPYTVTLAFLNTPLGQRIGSDFYSLLQPIIKDLIIFIHSTLPAEAKSVTAVVPMVHK